MAWSVTVAPPNAFNLSFLHARQVQGSERKRRLASMERCLTETVYAITGLPDGQATPPEIAS